MNMSSWRPVIGYEFGGSNPEHPSFMAYHFDFDEKSTLFSVAKHLTEPVRLDFKSDESAADQIRTLEFPAMTSPAIRAAELLERIDVVDLVDMYPRSLIVRGGTLERHQKTIRRIGWEMTGLLAPRLAPRHFSTQERRRFLSQQLS